MHTPPHCEQCSLIPAVPARPRRLRVFINPTAGSRKALATFRRVQPLFTLAKVRWLPIFDGWAMPRALPSML